MSRVAPSATSAGPRRRFALGENAARSAARRRARARTAPPHGARSAVGAAIARDAAAEAELAARDIERLPRARRAARAVAWSPDGVARAVGSGSSRRPLRGRERVGRARVRARRRRRRAFSPDGEFRVVELGRDRGHLVEHRESCRGKRSVGARRRRGAARSAHSPKASSSSWARRTRPCGHLRDRDTGARAIVKRGRASRRSRSRRTPRRRPCGAGTTSRGHLRDRERVGRARVQARRRSVQLGRLTEFIVRGARTSLGWRRTGTRRIDDLARVGRRHRRARRPRALASAFSSSGEPRRGLNGQDRGHLRARERVGLAASASRRASAARAHAEGARGPRRRLALDKTAAIYERERVGRARFQARRVGAAQSRSRRTARPCVGSFYDKTAAIVRRRSRAGRNSRYEFQRGGEVTARRASRAERRVSSSLARVGTAAIYEIASGSRSRASSSAATAAAYSLGDLRDLKLGGTSGAERIGPRA